ncbi:MAG TPA: c-type cytochrome [Tepidisphaeraceae bacterium]|jgi:mono/diheme cytochrome c family protein|nr:c-type cytochrome [Tepidisphaeraceae bacterium]
MNRCFHLSFLLIVATAIAGASSRAQAAAPAAANDPNAAGRLLLEQYDCTACHAASASQGQWLSPKVAPRLDDIASRASAEWIEHYLAGPNQTMPGTTMPDVLHALPAAERDSAAEALTHFLLSRNPTAFHRRAPDRAAVSRGEILYHQIGCVACHAPQKKGAAAIASTPLPNMAEKWSFDGLRRFLLDPLASRPSGRMPNLRLTDREAADLSHYLLRKTRVPAALELAFYRGNIRSLDDIDDADLVRTITADGFAVESAMRDRPSALRFSGWLRIDQPGDYTFYFNAVGASRLEIDGKVLAGDESWQRQKVDAKAAVHLTAGVHAIRVDYVHRGDRPASVKLQWEGPGIERGDIPTARLQSEREAAPEPAAFVLDPKKADAGRALYAKLNCAACHEQKAPAVVPPALAAVNDGRGCLADTPPAAAPDFHLNEHSRQALAAAIKSLNQAGLAVPSPKQRIINTMAAFNCTACHSRDGVGGVSADRDPYFTSNVADGGDETRLPPRLDGVGDKLQLAWLDRVLTQGAAVRPYINTRMPQFGKENVGQLAELFVAVDRKPEKLAASPDAPDAQKEAGRKLVGTNGGLSCIACHRFNREPAQAMQVMDLVTTTDRLNEDWFARFLRDPNRFHPGTRMPAFWPDGKSLLPMVLDGSTDRQLAAIWRYLADGTRAKFPEGLSRQNVELIVGGEPVVYRGKLWEAGFRAVAIGYPGGMNVAFDAEEMRLSLLWRGRFLNAAAHWQIQGMGQIHPLGTDVFVFPHGSPMAILADANAPWPAEASKDLGMKFRGYQFDTLRRPTLLYAFGKTNIEDFFTPIDRHGTAGLSRTITFTDAPPADLYMRLAAGKITAAGENSWRINDAMTVSVKAGPAAILRGKGQQQELIVPVRFTNDKRQLEVEYAW